MSSAPRRLWRAFTSLRLTLICLALLMVLVAACTLAQVELGTYAAVQKYMRSFVVFGALPGTRLSVPMLPGGALVGLVLGANLVAAQLGRLQLSSRKVGLWLAHAGLLLLLAGEVISGAFQVDMRLPLQEGETKRWIESPRELELAVIDEGDADHDDVYAVPEALLAREGTLELPGTTLALRTKRFLPNASFAVRTTADAPPLATEGVGRFATVGELPAVTRDDELNRAAAWVEPR